MVDADCSAHIPPYLGGHHRGRRSHFAETATSGEGSPRQSGYPCRQPETRREADARAEWIRRTQWALGAAASSNDTRHFYGITILEALARSDLTGPEDKSILDTVWATSYTKMHDDEIRRLIAEYEAFKEFDPERQDEVFAMLRREILAARLKVALDEQLGRETSPTVIGLGAMKLPPMARPRGRGGSHTKAAGPTSSSE